jgi:BirA family biotin operon repressor/biotin-[acetyl-CoA-carboxylase] ligase
VTAAYDGVGADVLARRLGVPRLALFAEVASTQDVAHALAGEGAADGTVVLADAQSGGRGRAGRAWQSPPGSGVWLTVVTRPHDLDALEVLALRVGLALAEALSPLAAAPVGVKWPNDLLVGGRKLAGVLVEARWRDGRPEWAAVGVGVNVRPRRRAARRARRDGRGGTRRGRRPRIARRRRHRPPECTRRRPWAGGGGARRGGRGGRRVERGAARPRP